MSTMRKSKQDIFVDFIVYLTLILLALSTLYPFINIIAKAFSGYSANSAGRVTVVPIDFQVDTFLGVIASGSYLKSLFVSARVAIAGTILGLLVSGMAAYALSRKRLRGRKGLTVMFVFTMMFSGGMIPGYILMSNLHLLNTIWVLFVPGAINVYNMLILKSSFEGLPESLEESAKIDGATNMRIFFSIMLPISLPTIAAISLFFAVGYWNEYWGALMYITSNDLKPLQLYLLDVINRASDVLSGGVDASLSMKDSVEGVRAATILASTIPILFVYPFLQNYFVKGIMIGSVKE